MDITKTHYNEAKYLRLFNFLSFAAISITVIYGYTTLMNLPEYLRIGNRPPGTNAAWISKREIWDDIRLMVTSYLVIFLLCIYLQLMPFKDGSEKQKALMTSFINLCISLVFCFTIISSVRGVCLP